MGVIAKGILRGCQGLFTPVSLGYPLSVFNKNSTLKQNGPPVRESDIVKAESFQAGEDPRATGGLVSHLPHPRVNKTKQHTHRILGPKSLIGCSPSA